MRKTPKTKAKTESHPQNIDVSSQRAVCIGEGPIQTPLYYVKILHKQQPISFIL